jgi:hypothetical protein
LIGSRELTAERDRSRSGPFPSSRCETGPGRLR